MGRDAKRFSGAEWQELLRRSRAMSAAGPADVVVQAVRDTDVVDEVGSEAASDAGDAGDGGAAPSVRLPEPSASPARVAEPEVVAGSRWSSFLQVKTILIRAVPALALFFGAIAFAFPRVWNVTKKVGRAPEKAGEAVAKAGETAFTVIEGLPRGLIESCLTGYGPR